MSRRPRLRSRQDGVAVVTALLLTTLAITMVASLFWQQQVQMRSIENQRAQLQKQWILRGALEWTRLILREDGRHSATDNLDEPWAVPLAETPLDQYVEFRRSDGAETGVMLSGRMIDAQSRFNLTNMCPGGKIDEHEVEAFARLLANLGLDPRLASAAAGAMAAAKAGSTDAPNAGPAQIDFAYVDDLLAVPGFTPETLRILKDYAVVLPEATPVNVNTAPPEVIAAQLESLSLTGAAAIVASRKQAYFRDVNDFLRRFPGRQASASPNAISVSTDYFIVNGNVRINQASLQIASLVRRSRGDAKVIWVRDY